MSLVELHVHLTGCLTADDVLALILLRSEPIDWSNYEARYLAAFGGAAGVAKIVERHQKGDATALADFRSLFVFGERDAGNFSRFLAKFGLVSAATIPLSQYVYQEVEPVPRPLTTEIARYIRSIAGLCRRTDVGYCEVRCNTWLDLDAETRTSMLLRLMHECRANSSAAAPATEAKSAVETKSSSAAAAVSAAAAGAASAGSASPLSMRIAIALPRENAMAAWPAIRAAALHETLGSYLTAVDFLHIEQGFPPRMQLPFARELRAFNKERSDRALCLLYHVGESFTDKSLESAVRWCHEAVELLGAQRLGHAIALGLDPMWFIAEPKTTAERGGSSCCGADAGDSKASAGAAPAGAGAGDNKSESDSTASSSEGADMKSVVHTRSESAQERLDQIAYDLRHAVALRAYGVTVDDKALVAERERLCAALAKAGWPEWQPVDVSTSSATVTETKGDSKATGGASEGKGDSKQQQPQQQDGSKEAKDSSSASGSSSAKPAPVVITVEYTRARLYEAGLRQRFACARVAEAGAVVEVCPTSNRRIGGFVKDAHKVHQFHRFLRSGLPFVVATDDPGLLDVRLADEIDWVCEHAELADVKQGLAHEADKAAGSSKAPQRPFAKSETAAELRARFRALLVRRAWQYRSEVLSGRVAAT